MFWTLTSFVGHDRKLKILIRHNRADRLLIWSYEVQILNFDNKCAITYSSFDFSPQFLSRMTGNRTFWEAGIMQTTVLYHPMSVVSIRLKMKALKLFNHLTTFLVHVTGNRTFSILFRTLISLLSHVIENRKIRQVAMQIFCVQTFCLFLVQYHHMKFQNERSDNEGAIAVDCFHLRLFSEWNDGKS